MSGDELEGRGGRHTLFGGGQRDHCLSLVEDPRAVADPAHVAEALVTGGHPPERLAVVEEDLESYFLRLVAGPDRPGRLAHREVQHVG